jgi:hypothetical protein
MSELLVLHLTKRIPYSRTLAPFSQNARESVEIHRISDIFDFSSCEGPEASLPSAASCIDAGILDQDAPDPDFFLDAGGYLFRQEIDGSEFDLGQALRAYIRDAWWEGRKIGDRLILRRVWEDGKVALQILCSLE